MILPDGNLARNPYHAGYINDIFDINVDVFMRSLSGSLKVSVILMGALYSSLVGKTETPHLSLATLKEMKPILFW